jgi:NAD(P)-dependent dehydrogenase (short-subunit alcohol dehydrogenase family)
MDMSPNSPEADLPLLDSSRVVQPEQDSVDEGELAVCLRVLRILGSLANQDPSNPMITKVRQEFAGLEKAAKKAKRAELLEQRNAVEQQLAKTAFVYQQHTKEAILGVEVVPSIEGNYGRPRRCYVCKRLFTEVNSLYHLLCPGCSGINARHRHGRVDLRGRSAIVTGGRIKIGFHLALKLLRDGAEVLVTTRFPGDAIRRFSAVHDSSDWLERLSIRGLDLCDVDATQAFLDEIVATSSALDILICNAAQTIRRPTNYFAELVAAEPSHLALSRPSLRGLDAASGLEVGFLHAGLSDVGLPGLACLDSQISPTNADPVPQPPTDQLGQIDETGEPLDTQQTNSWIRRIGEVSAREAMETYLVGAFAPFMMLSSLLPLLRASRAKDRHVVLVSAMEGQFARLSKTSRHPHTNMAKAAMNMLVRTSATELAESRIFLNAVDTGWITDENPLERKTKIRTRGFRPPLDVIDGAARIYHPIRCGVQGEPIWGAFLKDYERGAW